jgi:hypothetical protein
VFPAIWPDALPLYYFPHLLGLSLVGCIAGTYLTRPTDLETLESFYRQVRPWGVWGPIRRRVEAEDPDFRANRDFKRDMANVLVGTIWQTALVAAPFYLVLRDWTGTAVGMLVAAGAMLFLKKNWYDRLPAE